MSDTMNNDTGRDNTSADSDPWHLNPPSPPEFARTPPVMAVAGFVAVIGLTIGYLKNVTHQRYPSGRRAKEMEL